MTKDSFNNSIKPVVLDIATFEYVQRKVYKKYNITNSLLRVLNIIYVTCIVNETDIVNKHSWIKISGQYEANKSRQIFKVLCDLGYISNIDKEEKGKIVRYRVNLDKLSELFNYCQDCKHEFIVNFDEIY